jgi:uncharacterized protein YerC
MSATKFLHTELERHHKAFEQYYALGDKRTYRQLARELGISPSTIKLWSRSFSWPQRVVERDATIARNVADRAIQVQTDGQGQNQKIVKLALIRLAKAIAEGKVRMQLSDLERLLRLQAGMVDGHFTKHQQHIPATAEELLAYSDRVLSQVAPAVLQEANRMLIEQLSHAVAEVNPSKSEK